MKVAHDVEFPPFRLDIDSEQLWRGKDLLPLRPKTFAVLRYLLEHTGRLVTREELLKAVWPDTHGAEKAPKQCVLELRAVLGETPTAPRFIETMGRRGYRFIAPLVRQEEAPGGGRLGTGFPSSQVASLTSQDSNFVGRENELGQLHHCFRKALSGERQIVFVTGEPGIGKTTLVRTFLTQVPAGDTVIVARGQCVEHYGAGEAYLPVFEAFGRLGRAPGRQRLVDLLRRYAPTWLAQMPALIDEAELERLLRRVQGATSQRMLRELAEVVEVGTAETPLILVLEDLHWSDSATIALVAMLAARLEPARLIVIATYRPADVIVGEHPLRALVQEMLGRGRCQEIALTGLGHAAVESYLQRRFPRSALPSRIVDLLRERTEGNPLFLTNLVDDWVTHGLLAQEGDNWMLHGKINTIERSVPGSIRPLIQKQIERLAPHLQRLLEAASVAGATFAAAALAPALDTNNEGVEEQCEILARQQQFLRRTGLVEWPDGTRTARYAFRHALYQTVLQERIVPHRLQRLYQQTGERLETAYGPRAGELAAELAVHFEEGRDTPRAVHYRQRAAENALRKSAHQEALMHASAGLALVETLPETPERAQQELTLQVALAASLIATKGYAAREVEHAYARARKLCQQVGETPLLSRVLGGLSAFYVVRGSLQTARELGEQLLRLAQSVQNLALLMRAHFALGPPLFFLGMFASAQEHLERGLTLYDPQKHSSRAVQDAGVASLAYGAWTLWFRGYPDQALERSHKAILLAQELDHPYSLAFALNFAAIVHQFRRERQAAQEQAETAIALSTEQGFTLWLAQGTVTQGWGLVEREQEVGIARIRQGLAAWRATGAEVGQPYYLALLAEAYGNTGQAEAGLSALADALVQVDKTGERCNEAELYRLKGELLLMQESKKQKAKGKRQKLANPGHQPLSSNPQSGAEECFLKALTVAREQQAKSWELRAATSLARLWRHQGKYAEAGGLLSEVCTWFTEGHETKDFLDATALLSELMTATREDEQRKASGARQTHR